MRRLLTILGELDHRGHNHSEAVSFREVRQRTHGAWCYPATAVTGAGCARFSVDGCIIDYFSDIKRKNGCLFHLTWLFFYKNTVMKGKKPDHGRGTALAASPETQGTQIKGRLWLEKSGETFISWGRVILLERIKEAGSIAAAARSLEMAYSHAWTLVANMNRLAGEELVARTFGGKNGGRAWLTPAGEAAIAQFWELAAKFQEWLKNQDVE